MAALSKRMREKTALVVFVLLLLVGFALCAAYVSGMTRGLNVAASTIDEAAGELEGYTAIVFEGVPRTAKADTPDAAGGTAGSAAGATAAGGVSAAGASEPEPARTGWEAFSDAMRGKVLEDEGKSGAATAADASPDVAAPDAAAQKPDSQDAASQDSDSQADAAQADVSQDGASQGEGGEAPADAGAAEVAQDVAESTDADQDQDAPPTIEEVRDGFLDKTASSFVLDLADPAVYDKRTVIVSGGHRFGILCIQPGSDPAALAKRIAEYDRAGVDIVVAVTDSLASVSAVCEKAQAASAKDAAAKDAAAKDAAAKDAADGAKADAAKDAAAKDTDAKPEVFDLSDLDIVVSLADEGLPEDGGFFRGTFFVQAPASPDVGAVVVSPSKTFVSRVFA